MKDYIDDNGVKWFEDGRGNKNSVRFHGSEEEAKKALESLIDCDNCVNCRSCSYCSYCSYCRSCRSCSDCSYCRSCSYCRYCSDCSYCSDCNNLLELTHKDKETGSFIPPVIPKIENIHQAVYEAVSKPDALNMGNWHTCNTTHCRAGWVVHLAGEAGYALERFHDTALAAQLIYRESGYQINPCRFYDGNIEAMADMKRLAEIGQSNG